MQITTAELDPFPVFALVQAVHGVPSSPHYRLPPVPVVHCLDVAFGEARYRLAKVELPVEISRLRARLGWTLGT
jgi:hypothetical protein